MNANPKFISATATVDKAAVQPFPNSRKIYVEGSRPDIRVPMREITLTDTPVMFGTEKNPPIYVYDTSGPYSDPDAKIDIRSGLVPIRTNWILERDDTEELDGPTSVYGRQRLNDPSLDELRFNLTRKPRRAKKGKQITQMYYAKQGMITPEMEFVAIRESLRRKEYVESLKAAGPKGEKMAAMMLKQHSANRLGHLFPRKLRQNLFVMKSLVGVPLFLPILIIQKLNP